MRSEILFFSGSLVRLDQQFPSYIPLRLSSDYAALFQRQLAHFFSLNPASRSIEFFHVTHDAAGRYIRPNKRTCNRFKTKFSAQDGTPFFL